VSLLVVALLPGALLPRAFLPIALLALPVAGVAGPELLAMPRRLAVSGLVLPLLALPWRLPVPGLALAWLAPFRLALAWLVLSWLLVVRLAGRVRLRHGTVVRREERTGSPVTGRVATHSCEATLAA
jgi:uncharacterized membrane protein